MEPIKSLRKTFFALHPLSYRIKSIEPSREQMEKKLFIEIIDTLLKIDDRRDFMQEEIGVDMTTYEDQFFLVIENLMKLHFSKEQMALIQLYVYQLKPDKEWDGTITIEDVDTDTEKVVNFKTPTDLWNVVNSIN